MYPPSAAYSGLGHCSIGLRKIVQILQLCPAAFKGGPRGIPVLLGHIIPTACSGSIKVTSYYDISRIPPQGGIQEESL